jgi:hypothetical protein
MELLQALDRFLAENVKGVSVDAQAVLAHVIRPPSYNGVSSVGGTEASKVLFEPVQPAGVVSSVPPKVSRTWLRYRWRSSLYCSVSAPGETHHGWAREKSVLQVPQVRAALYQVINIESALETTTDQEVPCRICVGPLVARDGEFVLRYFLLRTAGRKQSWQKRGAAARHSSSAD